MDVVQLLVGFSLFMSGYLLKRVDRCDDNLIEHEHSCRKERNG